MLDIVAFRVLVVLIFGAAGYFLRPFQSSAPVAAIVGITIGGLVLFTERRMERMSLKRLIGAAAGGALGVVTALFASLVLSRISAADAGTIPFLELSLLLLLGYLGVALGAHYGELVTNGSSAAFAGSSPADCGFKILDTSVIIDGRIADIADTGFLDGVLVIPQFVLRELQLVADSADSMKRNRGRRGLDVLQRIQKLNQDRVRIVENDFPAVREVDLKLIELAKVFNGKIVTNDFNLNKVAQLRGVEVLNINELANALKPIVLPGETMRVFILKEGKEYNQGVAYLDDGTMVVVDNAKRMISKTIDVTVTSVLQTTAGKMIFGKHDDRAQAVTTDRTVRREQVVGEG